MEIQKGFNYLRWANVDDVWYVSGLIGVAVYVHLPAVVADPCYLDPGHCVTSTPVGTTVPQATSDHFS